MKLTVIGSSSKGNCYLLTTADSETLILEAGCKFDDVKKALHYDLSGVCGCLMTHQHYDHSMYVADVIGAGIKCYALEDVFKRWGIGRRGMHLNIKPRQQRHIGSFLIRTIAVKHNVPCLAYVIDHKEMGRLYFVTDTNACPIVPNVNHLMIEANYADDIVRANGGAREKELEQRHMEIGNTCKFIRDMSNDLETITLVHLSDENSDAHRFQHEAEIVGGVPTYIADKGVKINLSSIY